MKNLYQKYKYQVFVFSPAKRILLLLFIFLTIYSGCKKDNNLPVINKNLSANVDPAIVKKIKDLGFRTDTIKDFGDYYVVEGDIMLLKLNLASTQKAPTLMSKGKIISQTRSNYVISNYSSYNINVLIERSIWADANTWYSGVQEAVKVWNTQSNSNIKLNIIYDTYDAGQRVDIIIRSDNGSLNPNTAAQALFPTSDGKPGNLIIVNTDFVDPFSSGIINPTVAQTTWNMIHEIGHCLGFRHTNWKGNEGEFPVGAIQIPNTPQTDPNSVMNGGTAVSSYNSSNQTYPLPSVYDAIALGTLYPINVNTTISPIISGPSVFGGERIFFLSYISKETGINYHWKAIGINGNTFNWDFTDPDNNNPGLELNLPSGSYQLQCAISGGKYSSGVVATKTITVQ